MAEDTEIMLAKIDIIKQLIGKTSIEKIAQIVDLSVAEVEDILKEVV